MRAWWVSFDFLHKPLTCGTGVDNPQAMPNRSSNPKRPRDLNQLAKAIMDEATGEAPPAKKPEREKDPNAVALGRKGGLKGGKARAEKLSSEERYRIAQKAARARWAKREEGSADTSE
jgi:hypothetical protein